MEQQLELARSERKKTFVTGINGNSQVTITMNRPLAQLRVRRFFELFWPVFDSFLVGNIQDRRRRDAPVFLIGDDASGQQ